MNTHPKNIHEYTQHTGIDKNILHIDTHNTDEYTQPTWNTHTQSTDEYTHKTHEYTNNTIDNTHNTHEYTHHTHEYTHDTQEHTHKIYT